MDKGKMMMFIIIALLILLLGTVVAVSIYLLGNFGSEPDTDWGANLPGAVERRLSWSDLTFRHLGDARITTNLAVGYDGSSDSVVTDVVVGIDTTGPQDELNEFLSIFEERWAPARALVLAALNDHTYEQVRTTEGQRALGEYITVRLQEAFETNLIVQVQFHEWHVVRGVRGR